MQIARKSIRRLACACLLLTVRFLEASTSGATTELLWFASTGIGDKEGTVVRHKDILDLGLGCLINIFLVEGDERLCNGLTNSVNLRCVTTTTDSHTNIDSLESRVAEEEDRLKNLIP
mmetsp:Transcript_19804/g.32660  ORF Transcript_19804/g.32660 Transcript_19804/m.32660 type:complete len:118 (+) Transcript_19804:57-410(+)